MVQNAQGHIGNSCPLDFICAEIFIGSAQEVLQTNLYGMLIKVIHCHLLFHQILLCFCKMISSSMCIICADVFVRTGCSLKILSS